ncbi:hypothetical protein CBM2634_U20032 [Cupriavidus taiwanensis]|uniref:Uncharacterized protein n=1 Tax=Cupriavidus taiwanensis TaxID=164546 RepID=A0A375JC02_9BURK|nr:hypothetical protein CBM2634_U20032 [Cupriavidus taiwanensis]
MSGFGIVRTTVYFHEQTANRLGIAVSGVLTIRHGPLDLIEKNAGKISGLDNWCPQALAKEVWDFHCRATGGEVDASGTR